MQKFIDRFRYKASKAKQAQSRLKVLARMQTVAAVQVQNPFHFEFFEVTDAGNPAMHLDQARLGYADQVILEDVSLSLNGEDRIGLLGPNGAGKSTLLKSLAGKLTVLAGELNNSTRLSLGYFTQHQIEHLDQELNAIAQLQQLDTKVSEANARHYLGRFNFSNEKVFAKLKTFSGGERARLALALLIYQQPNVLLLDEPTNHLDMEMRAALIAALQQFTGALIVVSHDRYFLSSLIDQYWLVADGQVQTFTGDLCDYQRWYSSRQTSSATAKPTCIVKPLTQKSQKVLVKNISQCEKKLDRDQRKLLEIDQVLGDSSLYQGDNQERLHELQQQRTELQQRISATEEQLLALMIELDEGR